MMLKFKYLNLLFFSYFHFQVKEGKSGRLVGSQSGTYACIGPDPYIVRFNYPLGLFANTTYVITARIQVYHNIIKVNIKQKIQGPDSYKGVHGKLSVETRLLSGKKIRVDFSNVYGQKNNSSVKWGQIPFMIFS